MTRSAVIATIFSALVIGSSGCTWVALNPEAGEVSLATQNAIEGCTRVGTTRSRTKPRVGFFARSEEKVAQELATLARNEAPELGGNTVVAEGTVSADGTQRFSIYDCPR